MVYSDDNPNEELMILTTRKGKQGMNGNGVPTQPGWWWREGNHGPYIEEVDGDQNHALFLAIDGSDVVDDGTWLAQIPGPEVLAALAEYTEAMALADRTEGQIATWSRAVDLCQIKRSRLHAAIRAERDNTLGVESGSA